MTETIDMWVFVENEVSSFQFKLKIIAVCHTHKCILNQLIYYYFLAFTHANDLV